MWNPRSIKHKSPLNTINITYNIYGVYIYMDMDMTQWRQKATDGFKSVVKAGHLWMVALKEE